MPCDEYRPLVERLGRGDLPKEQEGLLDEHLLSCPSCRKAVALIRMDDAALGNALLGLDATGRKKVESSRVLRTTILLAVVTGLLLVGLYVFYGVLGDRAEDARKANLGATALERIVRPEMVDYELPQIVVRLEEQLKVPIDLVAPGESAPPVATLDLDKGIRLRSALLLLSELHGVAFRVGEDGMEFPGSDPVPEEEATCDLKRRLSEERATISYSGSDLRRALEHLGNVKALNVVVAPDARERVAAATAQLDVTDTLLEEILNGLLTPAGLTFEIRHEVVLIR